MSYNPKYFSGLTRSLSHVNHWAYNPRPRAVGSSPKTAAKQQPQLLTDGLLRGTAVAQIIHAAFQVAHRCLDALAAACVQRLCNGSVNAWVPET